MLATTVEERRFSAASAVRNLADFSPGRRPPACTTRHKQVPPSDGISPTPACCDAAEGTASAYLRRKDHCPNGTAVRNRREAGSVRRPRNCGQATATALSRKRRKRSQSPRGRQASAITLPPDPQPAEGQEREHRGIGQHAYAVERAEQRPALPSRPALQLQCQQEHAREDERRKRRIPDPVNRPVPHVGIQPPRIRRPSRDVLPECLASNQKNGNARERCEKTVDAQQNPRRCERVNAEHLENSANQKGIKRRFPCRRSGIAVIGIAEALPLRDRASDAAHFPAKFEVVIAGASSILMKDSDRRDLQYEGKR